MASENEGELKGMGRVGLLQSDLSRQRSEAVLERTALHSLLPQRSSEN
jgi:hypothetical protein